MALSVDQVIALVDRELTNWPNSDQDRISAVRRNGLVRVRDALRNDGFPVDTESKWALSLIPLVFQEANHDGIDWTERNSPLEHLEDLITIDVLVQCCGRTRAELSEDEYLHYVDSSLKAIDYRDGHRNANDT